MVCAEGRTVLRDDALVTHPGPAPHLQDHEWRAAWHDGPCVMRRRDSQTAVLADRWAAEYETETGHTVYFVSDGDYTYAYDIEGERLVCVYGGSGEPQGRRDTGRQRAYPPVPNGDEKGHAIAHSMGGGLDINLIPQKARMNHSREWRSIERLAADHPGTPVAVRLKYDDDSSRPSTIEYAYEHPDRGLVRAEFDNRTGALSREQATRAPREARSASRSGRGPGQRGGPDADRSGRSEERP